jgi:predicted DNA-binding transcriptional regulator AlpA
MPSKTAEPRALKARSLTAVPFESNRAVEAPPTAGPEQLLRLPQVMSWTGRPKASLYADKSFPRPIKLAPGARSSFWLASEVRTWIAERVKAARDPGQVTADAEKIG